MVPHLLQLQLKVELLKLEKKSADVDKFHLGERCCDVTESGHVIGRVLTTRVFRSSEVPGVGEALRSSAEPPEEPEQSEAAAVEASGSDQPPHPGGPAQVADLRWFISVFLNVGN